MNRRGFIGSLMALPLVPVAARLAPVWEIPPAWYSKTNLIMGKVTSYQIAANSITAGQIVVGTINASNIIIKDTIHARL